MERTKSIETRGPSEEERELLALLLKEEGLYADRRERILRRDDLSEAPLSSAQERLWFLHHLRSQQPDLQHLFRRSTDGPSRHPRARTNPYRDPATT